MAARRLVVEPRGRPPLAARVLFPVASVLGAGAIGAVLLVAAGHDPIEAYRRVVQSSFGSDLGWVRTLISSIPLIFTATAAAVAFRIKVWNIGGEGQFLLGAIGASGVALALGDAAPRPFALLLPLLAGLLAGALWSALAAIPRAYLRTDEVISTLMLNFVALHLVNYLIFGTVSFWRDPEYLAFPSGRDIPAVAELPRIWLRLHWGFPIAVATAVLLWWVLRSSRWGFDVRVIGDSPRAARYAGMPVARRIVSVLMVSGAIAGLGGAVHVMGTTMALQPGSLAVGFGYTGIVVAAVARLDALAIVPVSILIAGLTNAGSSLQVIGIPSEIVVLLQGLALLLVAAAEFLLHNRVGFAARATRAETTEAAV